MIYYSKNNIYVFFATYLSYIKRMWPIIIVTIIPTIAYQIALTWIILIVLAIISFIRWQNEYIVINEEYLIYKRGIIAREELMIPISSISLVEFNRNVIHKILRLNRMQIESVSPRDKHFHVIMVFGLNKANNLKAAFDKIGEKKMDINYKLEGNLSYKISKRHLPLLLTLKSNLILGVGTIYTAFRLLEEANKKFSEEMAMKIIKKIEIWATSNLSYFIVLLLIIIAIALIIAFIMLASLVGVISKYYKFRVFRKNNYIYIEYGFLVRKHYSIALENIHAIKLEQNMLNQLLNLYTIKCFAVGYGNSYKEENVIFPLCNEKLLRVIFKGLFPEFVIDKEFNKAPKRARNNFYTAWVGWSLVPFVLIYFLTGSTIGVIIVILAVIWRALIHKNAALGIGENTIYISCGSFVKSIYFIKNDSILECEKRVNLFQRRKKISDYKIEFYSKKRWEYVKVKNLEGNLFIKLKDKITI